MPHGAGHVAYRVVLLAATLLVVGCEPSVAPRGGVRLVVDSVGAPGAALDALGNQLMVCPVHLTLRNTGSSPAHWYGGTLRYYPGGDTTSPGDSLSLDPGAIAAAFGGSASDLEVRAGVGTWDGAAPAPYYGVAAFMFQSDLSQTGYGVAAVSFRCGVSTVGAHPVAMSPVIIDWSVIGSDTVIGGNFLRFKVALADSNGLWTSVFHDISGVCAWDLPIAMLTLPTTTSSTDGSLAMWFPECTPGPRAITLTVRDAFLHQTVDTMIVYVR